MRVKVAEIFDSIIGEGRFMGWIATFLRLAGCNLRCEGCDTAYAWSNGTEYDIEVVEYVLGNMVPRTGALVITGGEPLLQKDAVLRIAKRFAKDYDVLLETNGTIMLDEDAWYFLTVTVSPKKGRIGIEQLKQWAKHDLVDFKFVVGSRSWCWTEREIEMVIKLCGIERENVWLMPYTDEHGNITNAREVWEMAMRLGVNYSDRLHVRVWGLERGR